MNQLLQDARFALRQLRKSPAFALTAVVTLALGIGANTAIFTLVQGVLLRSLPVVDPAQLYRIGDTDDCCVEGGFQNSNGDFAIFSHDLYLHMKAAAPEFEQLAAVQAGQPSYAVRRGNAQPQNLRTQYVSGNFFSTFGVGAYAGRVFQAADDTPIAAPAAVVSYAAWQADFAGDPNVVGTTIFVQTHPVTVVGIAPPGFFGDRVTDSPPALWIPLENEPTIEGANSILHHADSNWLYAIGRLHPGASIPALNSRLSATLQQFLYTRPVYATNGTTSEIPKQHVVLTRAGGGILNLQTRTKSGLHILMILSTVVLLIACANIANLLLARGMARRSETSIRMALGARRRRLVAQMLTESVALAFLGGLVGLAVAYGGARTLLTLAFPDARLLPIEASPSLPVLGFAFAISLLTGIVFGIAPAWATSHSQPAEALRGVNRSTGEGASVPQKLLVVFQAALSLVLLAGAALLTQSLRNLEHQNFGMATENRYVVHIDPAGAGYTVDRLPQLYRQIEERFSALPGVAHVGMALYSPLEDDNWGESIFVQGRPAPRPNEESSASWDRVSPGFLNSIGVPILRGRGITEQDTAATQPVVVVNESFVKRFFPNEDPIGRHFGIDGPAYAGTFEIVGVTPDFKINDARVPAHRLFLRPLTQQFVGFKEAENITGESRSMFIDSIILSFSRPQQNVEQMVRRTLETIDPNLTVVRFSTYDAQVASNFVQERLISRLTILFGVLALILASVGLYGVTSYLVARRTSEIGIRMALGATRISVIRMVLRGAMTQILVGLALGVPAALFAGHLMANQLYGIAAHDPWALAFATTVLALCAAVAGYIPALRAASIEPIDALRAE